MVHQMIRSWSFAAAVCVIPCLGGCGTGLLGGDDVQPGACAKGPTPPFQPQVLPPKDSADRMKIYLLRGLNNTYSLGLDYLATEMRGLDLSPTMVGWPHWENTAQQIVSEYAGPADGSEYILIGHSYGADDAVRLARYMKDYGIQVQLLFLVDATAPDPIPDNVISCIHYYEPWLPGVLFPEIFSGNPVVADPGNSRTQIMNLLFTREALGEGVGCAGHASIDANELMHNLIMTEVFQLMAAHSDTAGSKAALSTQDALSQEPERP
jgi:pimeloyl-ACP methyl ester carboxylesterase